MQKPSEHQTKSMNLLEALIYVNNREQEYFQRVNLIDIA